jgi:phenylalanyl-tRNA synthetase beta chain
MAGLELDSLEPAAPAFEGVVVARVDSVEPHPDADKLRICQVMTTDAQPLQIVCGAPNVRPGMVAPLARVGAVLPDGLKIKAAKLRGVASAGMLCSAKELGLAESSDGLMDLPPDAPLGEDLRGYLDLDDRILEIDLTPNRADCLSIAGVAREASALTGAPVGLSRIEPVAPTSERGFPVVVEAREACPRYVGRVIEDIDPAASTPLWMRERLRRCGIRSLSPVVDVTNYVLLELGQPMHAFDLATLQDRIVVRHAAQGEALSLLDGREVQLDADTLVIADEGRAVAMAGVMGGEATAVGPETVDIFLESAYFAPEAIAGRARRHGLHTESSHRFERGVDPGLQARAVERATALLLEIVGGRPGPLIEVSDVDALPSLPSIALRQDRIERLLGVALPDEEVESILERLGCRLERAENGWVVTAPSWRFDLALEVDLIEELARVHGYDRIPDRSRSYSPTIRPRPEARIELDRLRSVLVERGYREVITYSFVDPDLEAVLMPGSQPLALANPISSELAVMRTSLVNGLLKVVQHNLNRQQRRQRLFETGLTFVPGLEGLSQRPRIGGVVCGPVLPEQWGEPARAADFYDLKSDIEALVALGGTWGDLAFRPQGRSFLHPGQAAAVDLAGREIGWLGALHPDIERRLDLGQRVYVFELDLEAISDGKVAKFIEISRFPAIRRDLAILVDESVSAAELRACVIETGIQQLREIHVFDIYTGEGVPKGRKSVALGLILQDLSRTLVDEEVEELIQRVVSRLASKFGATLRT